MKETTIVINSQVAYGYVGGSMATHVLRFNDLEVIFVPTVLLSNHLGFPSARGKALEPAALEELLEGIAALDIIQQCSCIYVGFIGSAEQAFVIARFIDFCKMVRKDINVFCDPIMGDLPQGFFVDPFVPDSITNVILPHAFLLTPNLFEFRHLCGSPVNSVADVSAAIDAHPQLQQKRIVITGCRFADTPGNDWENLVYEKHHITRISTDYVPLHPAGAGDLFAALLYVGLAKNYPLATAVEKAASLLTIILQQMQTAQKTEFDIHVMNPHIRI